MAHVGAQTLHKAETMDRRWGVGGGVISVASAKTLISLRCFNEQHLLNAESRAP